MDGTCLPDLTIQLLQKRNGRIDVGTRNLGTKPNRNRKGGNDKCGIAGESNRGQEKGGAHKLGGNRGVHLCLSLENLLDLATRQREDSRKDNGMNRRLRGTVGTRRDAEEDTRNQRIENNRNLGELEETHSDILGSEKIRQ